MNKAISILLALTFLISTPIMAQEATNSAIDQDTIEQSIQDRIQKALEENLDKAETTVTQKREQKNKALIGVITQISQNQITVKVNPDTSYEESLITTLTKDTDLTKAGKDIEQDDLQIGDYIISLGQSDGITHTATRVITDKYKKPTSQRKIAYTTINQIDEAESTITLTDSLDEFDEPLDVTKNTDIFDQNQEDLELTDLHTDQNVISILFINTEKETTHLGYVLTFGNDTPPTPSQSSTCGDGICQNVVCQGLDCPAPESPETCPADCTQ